MEIHENNNKRKGCGINVEVSTYLYGGYYIIKSLAAIVIGILSLIEGHPVTLSNLLQKTQVLNDSNLRNQLYPFVAITMGILGIIFSILLINGIAKRIAGFVCSFFVFALLMFILAVSGHIIIIVKLSGLGYWHIVGSYLSTVTLWIYLFLSVFGLILVNKTYKKIKYQNKQFAHSQLTES